MENPGSKISRFSSCGDNLSGSATHVQGPRALRDFASVQPGTIVGQLDHDGACFTKGAQRYGPDGILAGGETHLGKLNPVVDCIPDHVRERIANVLDYSRINSGFLAFDHQPC